ncbi:TPA: hypothetical protein QCH88_004323 [Enterobacter asburiae]|nr:hypothetical protein [Enterobacter asburiae]
MLSSKQTKDIGDMVCGKSRRKAMPTQEETTRLMMVREVFHESMKDQKVCVVLPDGKSEQEVFGLYYNSVRGRLRRPNVVVTQMKHLTVEHIEGNNCVVDLSEILITL